MQPPLPEHQAKEGVAQPSQPRAGGSQPPAAPIPASPSVPDHEMLRCIGSGSYGEVWLARNVTGQYRAAKVLYRDRFESDRPYEREFAGITRFEPISRTHDGFVDILQVGRDDSARGFYYVMELADDLLTGSNPNTPALSGSPAPTFDPAKYEARTLSATLARQGRLPVAECIRLGLALTAALEHLHRHSLVHRDIKPSNIIFVDGQPKLADVGLVADTSEAHSLVGTHGFIPPEGPGSAQADLYALGKVLYAASTGHGATAWPNPLTALAELPEQREWLELNEVINKACDPDPRRRYASAADMQVELALLQSGRSLKRQRMLEKRLKQAGLALAGIALLGAAGLFIQQTRLQLVRERVKAAERQALLLNLEKEIRPPHTKGWSERAWLMASNAARAGFDNNLQSQAAASLAGLDAKLGYQTNGIDGSSVVFDREGNRVLFGSLSDQVGHPVRDGTSGRLLRQLEASANVLALTPDGSFVAAGSDDGEVTIWRISDGHQFSKIAASRNPILSLTFCRDPVRDPLHPPKESQWLLAIGDSASGVAIWEVPAQRLRTPCWGAQWERTALAFTADGTLLASGGRSPIVFWDVASGHRVFDLAWGDHLTGIAISDDGRQFAATWQQHGEPAHADVLALENGRGIHTLRGLAHPVTLVCFSRDGQLVAALSGGWQVGIWDFSHNRLLHVLNMPRGLYTADNAGLAFSPDRSQFAFMAGTSPTFALLRADGWEIQRKRRKTCDQLDNKSIDMLHEITCMYSNVKSTVVVTGSRPNRFGTLPAVARSHAKSCSGAGDTSRTEAVAKFRVSLPAKN